MAQNDTSKCRNVCWIVGIIGGVIAFFLLKGAMATLLALILAVVVAVCLGFILIKAFCAKDVAAAVSAPAAPKAAPASTPAAPKAEPAPAPEAAPAPAAEPAPAAAPVETPVAAASTGPDDLKKLKGVGPKIEEKLNAAGVTSFAQIAAWDADDIAKMDDLLAFKGRIARDGWVEQAKTLASGGSTDFAKRVEDGDVY
ncbi:helix-hairpin-helix domain-containing protein [Shimia aestuarii]|uniref:helix-hairpin-helix domain-containing protein n=1 Tax=Shimia aestuarii TaxID=254406 RepID=UPI001FB3DB50|nr:helix-hairpin-helix domain-containing protein [Shimia aestuarii]